MAKARPYPTRLLKGKKSQRTFTGANAAQIAMPLGGIGAGCVCLNGSGGLQDFSIRNQPATTAMPDRHAAGDQAFAVLHVKGRRPLTRLVEGPYPTEKIYSLGLKAGGNRGGDCLGLPCFERCSFRGEYPFGFVRLSDRAVPLRVSITGFSPFVPLDDVASGAPCAVLEYTLENRSNAKVDYEFSYHLSHLAAAGPDGQATRNVAMPDRGVFLYNKRPPNAEDFGSASLTVIGHRPAIKAMWFRGGWFDSVSVLWRELTTGTFQPNDASPDEDTPGRNGGSILLSGSLKPGQQITYPIVITWYFPNCYYVAGQPPQQSGTGNGEPPDENASPKWRPFYTSQWNDAREVAEHVHANYVSLRDNTQAFHQALFRSSLPSYVLDAVSANLAILKSPTVLRQENGNVWAWEGCFCDAGCCYGSCTHVWNYAQALPHLFPHLERTLREQELDRSMDDRGHVNFRSALPDGPTMHDRHAAADGQLGGIMKLYRDWQIGGDDAWLLPLYPAAKKSIDYGIETWDPQRQGVLTEPHHNTYDIEFWGPDGMCSSIYVAALTAMSVMAQHLEYHEDAQYYDDLAARGAAQLDGELFNGRYFQQKVMYETLRDTSFTELIAGVDADSTPELQLLEKEGPKYQYGSGCLSDGVIGAWMAKIYGIDTPQTSRHVRRHLKAVFQHNFKHDLADHACTQRPGYAIGHEPGLLLCTWPNGGKPTLPFVYSDEVWTGIEYQVASHLIEEGMVDEGLTIVRAARSRYDGRVRNPWNEYECGSYYARAMASYALMDSLSGFRYSAVTRTLWFGPRLTAKRFRAFFCTGTGWGTILLTKKSLTIRMIQGQLAVDRVRLTLDGKTREIPADLVAETGTKAVVKLG